MERRALLEKCVEKSVLTPQKHGQRAIRVHRFPCVSRRGVGNLGEETCTVRWLCPAGTAAADFSRAQEGRMLTFKGFRRPTAKLAMPHVHHIDISIAGTELDPGAQTVYVLQVNPRPILTGAPVHAGPSHMRNGAASGDDQTRWRVPKMAAAEAVRLL